MSSTCSQALADSASGLSGQACELSPSVSASHTPAPSSQGTGLMSLVTTTCEPSAQIDLLLTESESMSSAGGSPARTSALPELEQGLLARGLDCGGSTPDLLAKFDPATSSWRTSQHCLVEGLAKFSETWPRSGLMRSGTAYRLPPLVPLTDATGSGSSPMWPTPQASDNRDRGNLSSGAVRKRMAAGKQLMLSQIVSEKSGALNPTWVEALMGFPYGWTDTSEKG
jgi:hypothetical protein